MFPGPSCGKPDDTLDFLREVLFSRRLFEEFHKYISRRIAYHQEPRGADVRISGDKWACGKVSRVLHMVFGGSRESLPKRKVRLADKPPGTTQDSLSRHNEPYERGCQEKIPLHALLGTSLCSGETLSLRVLRADQAVASLYSTVS